MINSITEFRNLTLDKIKKSKYAVFGSTVIKRGYSGQEFEIILLTSECAENTELMDLLGRWRKENERWYLSQFAVSTARTTKWFRDKLVEVPDRLLFIIKLSGKYIGHAGLFRFDFDNFSCEIDNILRGENDFPGIMGLAVKGLMDWARANLGLRGFTLKVLSDNQRAIKFYKNLGFEEVSRIPLVEVSGKDGPEWIEAPQDYRKEAARNYVVMKSS